MGFAPRDSRDLQRGKDFIERRLVLQLAQVGRVRRTDVDDKEIREVAQNAEGVGVILGGLVQRRDLGFAEVDAHGMGGPAAGFFPFGEFLRHGFRAGIVEAHAVDDGLVGIARNMRGGGLPGCGCQVTPPSSLNPKPSAAQRGHGGSVLVHAGREADGIGEGEAEEFHRQRRGMQVEAASSSRQPVVADRPSAASIRLWAVSAACRNRHGRTSRR